MKEIQGHVAVTPFKRNGTIDFDTLPVIINHLIAGGLTTLSCWELQQKPLHFLKKRTWPGGSYHHSNSGRLPLVLNWEIIPWNF